jgi:hypothetical protein
VSPPLDYGAARLNDIIHRRDTKDFEQEKTRGIIAQYLVQTNLCQTTVNAIISP